jgi:hypothetical protein
LRQSETEKPAHKPRHSRPQATPKANPPPPSPVDQFYERFQQDMPDKRSTDLGTDTSAQNKPAPKPSDTRAEPKPRIDILKALTGGGSGIKVPGGPRRIDVSGILKAAPSSVVLSCNLNAYAPPPKAPALKPLEERTPEENIAGWMKRGMKREDAEKMEALQRGALEESKAAREKEAARWAEWKERDRERAARDSI